MHRLPAESDFDTSEVNSVIVPKGPVAVFFLGLACARTLLEPLVSLEALGRTPNLANTSSVTSVGNKFQPLLLLSHETEYFVLLP